MSKVVKIDFVVADMASANDDTLDLIMRESDKRIAAQIQIMLAVDSRSTALLSASAALAATAAGVATSQYSSDGLSALGVGAAAFAVCATVGAVSALVALWPRDVDVQGWSPIKFKKDLAAAKASGQILREIIQFNQSKIEANENCNERISIWVKVAMAALVASPVTGGIFAAIKISFPSFFL